MHLEGVTVTNRQHEKRMLHVVSNEGLQKQIELSNLLKSENIESLKAILKCCKTHDDYLPILWEITKNVNAVKSIKLVVNGEETRCLLIGIDSKSSEVPINKLYLITDVVPSKFAEDPRYIGKFNCESNIISFGNDNHQWYLKPLNTDEANFIVFLTKRKSVRPDVPRITTREDNSMILYRSWENLANDLPNDICFEEACKIAKSIRYDSLDISQFISKIAGSYERKTGPFLSALINNGNEQEYIIDVRDLNKPISIGFRSSGKLKVIGDCGAHAGKEQIGGEIIFYGNTGYGTCAWKSGGIAILEGHSGDFTGLCMSGGEIFVLGGAGENAFHEMTGGLAEFNQVKSIGKNSGIIKTEPDRYVIHFSNSKP